MRRHRHSRMVIAPCVTCGEPWGGVVASASCWLGARFGMVPHDAGPVTRRGSTWGAAPYPGESFQEPFGGSAANLCQKSATSSEVLR